jgi:hypothetical protein
MNGKSNTAGQANFACNRPFAMRDTSGRRFGDRTSMDMQRLRANDSGDLPIRA